MTVAHHQSPAALIELAPQSRQGSSTSSSSAAANMRRAPSRQISSNVDASSPTVDESISTVNIGVPSSPAFQRQRLVKQVNEEGTSRPQTDP
jgi:hypothetical protein